MANKSKECFSTEYERCRKVVADITSREEASALTNIGIERLSNIESGKTEPTPYDILNMAEAYGTPYLYNYYCHSKCPIGQKWVPEITVSDISDITIKILSALVSIEEEKNRLIEIVDDKTVSPDEEDDFELIKKNLTKIIASASALLVWAKENTKSSDE